MDEDIVNISDVDKLCRVCLANVEGDLIGLNVVVKPESVETENCDVGSMLMNLISLEVKENDGLPKHICERCVEGIYIAFTIKKQATRSDQKLRELIKTTRTNNLAKIESVIILKPTDEQFSSSCSEDIDENHEEADDDNDLKDSVEEDEIKTYPIETLEYRKNNFSGTRCCGCRIDFDTEKKLLEHSKTRHLPDRIEDPNKKFECSICYKRYVTKTSLNRHNRKKYLNSVIRNSRKLDENKCCGCREKFETPEKLLEHSNIIHLPDRFLDRSGTKPVECPICYNRYLTKEAFNRHKQNIYEEKFYSCAECSMSFVKRSMLKNHELKYHGRVKQELLCGTYQCATCGKTFLQPSSLKNHEKIHLEDKPFECKICRRGFSSKGNLQTHEKLHVEPSKQKVASRECPICNVRFKTANYLDIHVRVHTGEKPYKCDWCEKMFAHSAGHKRHLLTHTGVKPHICRYCSREFANRSNMLIHEKGHLGEKNATCDLCGKDFVHSRYMKKHRKRHFMEKSKTKSTEVENISCC